MKKILLGVLFLSFFQICIAQQLEFTLDNPNVTGHPDSFEVVGHAKVKNISSNNVSIRWVKEEINFPAGWSVAICDNNACYPTRIFTNYNPDGNPKIPVVLAPGQETIIDPHLYPAQTSGAGQVKVCISLVSDPANPIECFVFNFDVSGTSSTKNVSKSELKIYPNPTTDYFSLQAASEVSEVRLMSILGKNVRSFEAAANRKYYIGDLPSGMYLASLIDRNGKIVRTVRVVKRTLMP